MIWWLVVHPDGTGETVATAANTMPEGFNELFPVAHRIPYGKQWRTRQAPARRTARPNAPAWRVVTALRLHMPDAAAMSGPVLVGAWSDHRRGRRQLEEITRQAGITVVHSWREGRESAPDPAERLRGRQLSDRELQCTAAVADGLTFADTASRLGLPQHTVRDDLQRAKAKLGARSTAHLVGLAVARGLVHPTDTAQRAAA
jgi:DNA-binding CsgD family transcriptional regulator